MSKRISLTDEELEYLRYLIAVHAGTELEETFHTQEEIKLTDKLIEKLRSKFEVS